MRLMNDARQQIGTYSYIDQQIAVGVLFEATIALVVRRLESRVPREA